MKKFLILVFMICFFWAFSANVIANTVPTLEQIANKFNNHSTVKEYATMGSIWKATASDNKLTISVSTNDTSMVIEYTLVDNILSTTVIKDDSFTANVVTTFLIDCIGQFHGYSEGDLNSTLQSEKIVNYTLTNEGLEMLQNSSGGLSIKIDISKKIPLLDLSNDYFTVEDLDFGKGVIAGDGSSYQNKGNVRYNKSGYDGENTVLVAEKNRLTENSYKSLLSIIEVMFNSKDVVNYFKQNYPRISSDTEFKGFKIEINPVKTDWEERLIPSNDGYEFFRISIDKNVVNNIDFENSNVDDGQTDVNLNNQNDSSDSELNEDINLNLNLYIIIILVFVILVGIIFYLRKKST